MQPTHSPMRRTHFASLPATALLVSCALAVSAMPLHAQPPERAGEGRVVGPQETAALRGWQGLVAQVGTREVTAPRQTIELYQQFAAQQGAGNAEVEIGVAARCARILWRVLGERDQAVALYRQLFQSYRGHPGLAGLRAEWEQLQGEAEPGLAPVALPKFGAAPAGTPPLTLKWPGATSAGAPPVALKWPGATMPQGAALGTLTLPATAGAPPSASAPVNAGRLLAIPTLLRLLEQPDADAEVLWQTSGLASAELPGLLVSLGAPNKSNARQHALLRGRLAALLARHGGALLQEPEALPLVARVALADHYARQKDARAVAFYESALAERLAGGKSVRPVSELWGLAHFYRDTGEMEQAVASYLRAGDYSTSRHMIDEMRIEAARLLMARGQSERAGVLYQQVQSEGAGWMKGLALYDQANGLMAQGQHESARQLLKTPVAGKNAEQIKVALLSLLGYSYYKTGELETARQYAQQSLKQAASVKLIANEGLEAQLDIAETVLRWSEQWPKTPIVVEPQEMGVTLFTNELQSKTVAHRVLARTFRDVPLEVQIDNPQIKGHVMPEKRETAYFVQKEVMLEVVPGALTQNVDATLTMSSPQFPAYQARIPIHIEVPKPIQLSSSTLFFGQVEARATVTKTLTLSASMPFRVLDVKSDSPFLEAKIQGEEATKEQQVELKFTAPLAQQFYSGTIRIKTDVATQPLIEILYSAQAD